MDEAVSIGAIADEAAFSRRDALRFGGNWQYQAGARAVAGGLELSPTGLAIVNKRKNGEIDPNPPLNTLGPRLQAEGDFALSTQISSNTAVSFQLYGQPPLRFDDFRYERSRIDCMTAGNVLSVRVWDGRSQQPAVYNVPFSGSVTDRHVEAQRRGNDLIVSVNGNASVVVSGADHLFAEGSVWFGLNSEQGPARVSKLVAQSLNGHRLALVDLTTMHVTQPVAGGLQSRVQRRNFRIGAAVAAAPLASDPAYAEVYLGGEVGSWTVENGLKPQDVQPIEGAFVFNEADAIVGIADRHGIDIHGHTLVYADASPQWMTELSYKTAADKQRVRQVLEQHIKTVVSHYQGKVASWDVVNEAIGGFDDQAQLNENFWYKALGEAYIAIAFRAAREADPDAKLYINDYGLETNPGRRQVMVDLVKRLQAQGVPIDGIGIQGHVNKLPRDDIKRPVLRSLMDHVGMMNLEVRVSELDVTGDNGAEAQAEEYANTVGVGLAAQNCTGVTVWELQDRYGAGAYVDSKGQLQPSNALLYDTNWRSKPARQAMAAIL